MNEQRSYTVEEVEAMARSLVNVCMPSDKALETADMLRAYAASLKAPAQGGVTDAMVERAYATLDGFVSEFAQPAERVPDGEVRLWDTQWMNIVNHDDCYRDWDKADAINHAVKMTEQAIARNVADGKLPSARITASPAPSEGGKGVDGKEGCDEQA